MEETMQSWAETIKEKLISEAVKGGELVDLPCPFCQRPRSQRSEYIRCTPCGINWAAGEDLSKDPKIQRFQKMLASMPKQAKATP